MNLIVIGISHKTAHVKERERFSFTRKRLDESLTKLKDSGLVTGAVILSTCNRTEIYLHGDQIGNIKLFVFGMYGANENDIARYFYVLRDADAIRHIFRVASGLDSQVLGETQILSQVTSAWAIARERGITNTGLDEIFETAQKVGKMVRSGTKISQGNVSVGSVAIRMLEERFGSLRNHSVLIIGAGKIGALISKYLKEKGIKGIFVASRTYARAVEMAAGCGGKAVDFTRLEEELKGVDIVISSTSSPHIVLKKDMLINVMRTRKKKPIFIMDLALPRDVDAEAREIEGISLCDLDNLKCVVEENFRKREKEAVAAERLVEREVNNFMGVGIEILSM